MNETETISIISILVNLVCVVLTIKFRKKTPKGQYRRFLKLLLTGKYEEPKA